MRSRTPKTLLIAASSIAVLGAAATQASAAPTASTPPTISGRATFGATLTCANGTWSAGAGSFVYQWQLANTGLQIGTGTTLRVKASWVSQGIICAVTGQDTTGTATASSSPVTAQAATPTITVTRAREISTATRKIQISGRIAPTASLKGGAASLILYRETSSGLQQLSFNGSQTHPKSNGTFTLDSTGEPKGRNTYVLDYVPSALGYATQTVVTHRITVTG